MYPEYWIWTWKLFIALYIYISHNKILQWTHLYFTSYHVIRPLEQDNEKLLFYAKPKFCGKNDAKWCKKATINEFARRTHNDTNQKFWHEQNNGVNTLPGELVTCRPICECHPSLLWCVAKGSLAKSFGQVSNARNFIGHVSDMGQGYTSNSFCWCEQHLYPALLRLQGGTIFDLW